MSNNTALSSISAAPTARFYHSPYLLLVLTTLFWGGNAVVGRAIADTITPLSLAFWRWCLALVILTPYGLPPVLAVWPVVRERWAYLITLGVLGIAVYNTMLYFALAMTSAISATVVTASLPVLIASLSWLVFRETFTLRQIVGFCLSLSGVLVVLGRGDPLILLKLDFNAGDLTSLLAAFSWAAYSLLLRRRPAELSVGGLLYIQVAVGAIALLPFYLWDSLVAGHRFPLNEVTVGALIYVALFPSVLSFFFWNRAVATVGPSIAGLFINLIPIFASLLAIVFLGESLHLYHGVSLILLFCGIILVTRTKA